MIFHRIEELCFFISEILDGVYGSFYEIISLILFVLIFNFLAKWILKKIHHHYEKQKKIWQASFVSALYRPLSYYTLFFAFTHSVDLFSQRVLGVSLLTNVHLFLNVGLILSITWFLLRWKNYVITYMVEGHQHHHIGHSKLDVINKLITVVLTFITLLAILEVTGRSMNTIIAFGGVGGLALAFASQEIIANFFGGLMIYLTHPFAIGDWVYIPERDIEGHIEEIGWYTTRMRTFEKRPVYIPNATFTKVLVMTPSRMSHRQFKEKISLRYCDMPVLKKIIVDIKTMLNNHHEIDQKLSPFVHLEGFGTYSIDVLVSAYTLTTTTEGFAAVQEDLLFKIYDILTLHGAEMAFPTTQFEYIPQNQFENERTPRIAKSVNHTD